jgi:hypothetical protein
MKPTSKQTTMPELLPTGDLDRIARETKTDKHSGQHDYLRSYEWVLKPYRAKKFTLLELGVGQMVHEAGSLKTWKAYFKKAQIIGVDINAKVKAFEEPRIAIEIGNAAKPRFLRRMMKTYEPAIVIDDASHIWSHQILSLRTMFPMLQPGGVMIIEDIHTSFITNESRGFADTEETFYDVLQRLQTILASGYSGSDRGAAWEYELAAWIDVITLTNRSVIFIKRHEPVLRGIRTARRIRKSERQQEKVMEAVE